MHDQSLLRCSLRRKVDVERIVARFDVVRVDAVAELRIFLEHGARNPRGVSTLIRRDRIRSIGADRRLPQGCPGAPIFEASNMISPPDIGLPRTLTTPLTFASAVVVSTAGGDPSQPQQASSNVDAIAALNRNGEQDIT